MARLVMKIQSVRLNTNTVVSGETYGNSFVLEM